MNYFSFYDSVVAFISAFTYVADVGTDIWFLFYIYTHGAATWWCLSLSFVVLASLLMLIFSFRWHAADKSLSPKILLIHTLFLAPLYRYYRVIKLGFQARRSGCQPKHEVACREVNDVSVLRLIETFFEAAPQLFLQLYIIFVDLNNFKPVLIISSVASLVSLSWAVAAYSDARNLVSKKLYKRSAVSVIAQAVWQTAMVTSRMVAFALFASVLKGLVAIPIALHLVIMMVWVAFVVRPDFGTTTGVRCVFTFVSALIFLFCFLNLKEGSSRGQMFFFYIVTLIENSVFVTVWYFYQPVTNPTWLTAVAFAVVYGAFVIGSVCPLIYYKCCHPSGPAPLSQNKQDHQRPPTQFRQVELRPDPHKDIVKQKNQPVFDISTSSARVNLWLSASLDLSKEGLIYNPDEHLDPSTQGHRPRPQQSSYQNSQDPLVPATVDRSFRNAGVSNNSFAKESVISSKNTSEDRLDFSKRSNIYMESSNREFSLPDYNLVEMFSRCKFDPSYVSTTSFDDSLDEQYRSGNRSAHRIDQSRTSNISTHKSIGCRGRPSVESQLSRLSTSSLARGVQTPDMFPQTDYSPINISPLDVNKLWEESQGRLTQTPLSRMNSQPPDSSNWSVLPFGSDPQLNRNSTTDSAGLSLLPGLPTADGHLSLSYSTIDRTGQTNNSGFSESASSFLYKKGLNKSGMSKSDMLSFSNASLPLPDGSSRQRFSSNAPDIVQCTSPPAGKVSLLRSPLDRGERNRSKDSYYSREYSSSDRQSSYLSDRGVLSDQGMASSSNVTSELSRGSASSGFQSEESNLSRSSPMYRNIGSQFQSTPIVENEISSIYALPSSIRPQRESLDKDIELNVDEKGTPVGQKQTDETPDKLLPMAQRLLYSESSDSIDSPKLPPLTVRSRCSSSTGSSSSSSRFFKDPTVDEDNSDSRPINRTHCIDTSQRSLSGFMEKSSLSAYLSNLSSSRSGSNKSEESLAIGSDHDLRTKRFRSRPDVDDNMIKKAVSMPHMPVRDELLKQSLVKIDSPEVPIYENVDIDTSGDLSSGSHVSATNLLSQKPASDCPFRLDYLSADETEKTRLRELYTELSEASGRTLNESELPSGGQTCSPIEVTTLNNSPYRLRHNADMFSRDGWRSSLDKEMRDRLVSDIEKLAPKKLYQLQSKKPPGGRKLSPVDIQEYKDSPYKFRRPGGAVSGSKKITPSPNSISSEYENINSLTGAIYTDYQNLYDLSAENTENCPIARPESLSDRVLLDENTSSSSKRQSASSALSDDKTNSFTGEYSTDSFSDSLSSRSSELSRTKSPINTSGINSAFKPVKSRSSVESNEGSFGNIEVSNETYSLQKTLDNQNILGSSKNSSSSLTDNSSYSKEARSRGSGLNSGDNSTFQWSRNTTQETSLTNNTNDFSNQVYVNYLQLVGKDPLNFSVGSFKLPDNTSIRSSQHSYTDSIPWEDSENMSQNASEVSSTSQSQLTGRKPLAALENTPRFSPIYGLVGPQGNQFSRKRFMSTPKISGDTSGPLSQNSTCESLPSFSASVTRTPRRSSHGLRQKCANDTSAWTTHSDIVTEDGVERFESSSLSKTTYI